MSMISGQCDKLRKMADKLETYGGYGNIVSELRDTADLILELRDDLQQANAENSKLRELVLQLIHCVERVGNEDVFYYQPTRDGCGFDCLANGEHCSFAKICDRARELGIEVDA